ncbi:hypothetical protein [Lentzea sp. NPDC004782]|uniref:hypothetical protein n=1 Tax=Lentzea sp. NPDC004782 TaxID=3154458 RepID=UPI00339FA3FB
MARDDDEDAVFEWAVQAASEEHAPDNDEIRVLRVAKPLIMASASAQRDNYVAARRSATKATTVGWAARRVVFWRWGFVVVIPVLTWTLVGVIYERSPVLPGDWRLVALVLGLSLAALALSSAGYAGKAVARWWALAGFIAGAYDFLAFGEPVWKQVLFLVLVLNMARQMQAVLRTVLPARRAMAKLAAVEPALAEWRAAVLNDGVLPVLRAERASRQVVLGNELAFTDSHRLLKGGSMVGHQPVRAGWELAALVDTLDAGSLALAGPRGAGKTSVLRAFCQGAYRKPDQPADLTVLVAAPVDYVPREFVLHLYARACQAVLAHLRNVDEQVVKRAGRRDWWWESPTGPVLLARSAQQGLRDIAYVQTHSGESSGKIGFRGVEMAFKRGVSLTGRPATFPEVVDDFRQFVRAAAKALAPARVVIAIDEMDRIGAGEPARRFLNEIKAIFDVPGCYYLMSVSTEAQHDFELAGSGLRSVFDSSFDEVVRVDYLDFDLARALISRSVEGLPESFVALAYAFSGGLARQLTRSARAIVRQQPGTRLEVVAANLAADELDRVCKTTGDALTAVESGDGVTGLLRVLADPSDDLRGFRKAIQDSYTGEDAPISNLRDLAAARVEFLAVVRDHFADDLAEVVPAQVNALARARRYAGSNPATGLALLEEFSAATPGRPAPAPPPP